MVKLKSAPEAQLQRIFDYALKKPFRCSSSAGSLSNKKRSYTETHCKDIQYFRIYKRFIHFFSLYPQIISEHWKNRPPFYWRTTPLSIEEPPPLYSKKRADSICICQSSRFPLLIRRLSLFVSPPKLGGVRGGLNRLFTPLSVPVPIRRTPLWSVRLSPCHAW